jgi:hypothetical protein
MNEAILNVESRTTNVLSFLIETGDTNFIRTVYLENAIHGHRHTS